MKGILLKPDMIKAIVEDRKTVTRRLFNPQPDLLISDEEFKANLLKCGERTHTGFGQRYFVGEVVYIKEFVKIEEGYTDWFAFYDDNSSKIVFPSEEFISKHITDGMFGYTARTMPAWAARFFLKINKVDVEGLCLPLSVKELKSEGGEDAIPLLEKMNGKWVWKYSFVKVDKVDKLVHGKTLKRSGAE